MIQSEQQSGQEAGSTGAETSGEAVSTSGVWRIQEKLEAWVGDLMGWVAGDFLSLNTAYQAAALLLAVLLGRLAHGWLRKLLNWAQAEYPFLSKIAAFIDPVCWPLMTLVFCASFDYGFAAAGLTNYLLSGVTSLLTAWVVIRAAVTLIRSEPIQKAVATVVWAIAALNIVGLLDPIITMLDQASLTIGNVTISLFGVITGIMAFVLFIWGALVIARLIEGRLDTLDGINASARELIKKTTKIGLVSVAFLLALNATGIDLTALAVFGGALGVGIGFGLQKVVGNFISGVILLLDRSIKPGDVIETQGTYGWINRLAARYTSIITRDGTEYLIPNEDMITQPVLNWTHSHSRVRRKVPVQVDYGTDLDLAIELMNEAAEGHPRVLSNPKPRTLLKSFGADGVDLELRMWIQDPQNGVANVASDVMLQIWRRFHEKGIEFPFPQRTIHFAKDLEADKQKAFEQRASRSDQDEDATPPETPASEPEERPDLDPEVQAGRTPD